MKARIGIDLRPLQQSQAFQGTGFYAKRLLNSLLSLPFEEGRFVFFSLPGTPPPIPFPGRRGVPLLRPFPESNISFLFEQVLAPIEVLSGGISLFHALMLNNLAFYYPCKLVLSLLDVIPLIFRKEYMKTGIKLNLLYSFAGRADAIITISRSSRRDISRLLGIGEERIFITYLAPDPSFHHQYPEERIEEVRRRYGTGKGYILYTGGFQGRDPRKNTGLLLEIARELGRRGMDYRVVLAGRIGEYGRSLKREVSEMGIGGRVIFTDFVPEEDLPPLMAGATLFAFPSLYEGFGLPVIEAMACGTPVVAFSNSSIPEVTGDAALLVPDRDDESFVRSVFDLLARGESRRKFREAGILRAGLFTWERTAMETLKVYRTLLMGGDR